MALKDSLKKLFGTSKKLGVVKMEELKDKANPVVENAKEFVKEVADKVENAAGGVKGSAQTFGEKAKNFGEDFIEKAGEKLDKLEDKAEIFVEDLNTKLQGKLKKPDAIDEEVIAPVDKATTEVSGEVNKTADKKEEVTKKAKE